MSALKSCFFAPSCAIAASTCLIQANAAVAELTDPPVISIQAISGPLVNFYNSETHGTVEAMSHGSFHYYGTNSNTQEDGGYELQWDLIANPDPYIQFNTTITNNTTTSQTYNLVYSLPLGDPFPPGGSVTGGSIIGGVTDLNGNGASLTSDGLNPIYTAFTQVSTSGLESAWGELLAEASATTGAWGSALLPAASFGDPIPSAPGPASSSAADAFGISLAFTLSAGDSASFGSIFVIEPVPAPGAAVLLLLAGPALGFKRRRCID